MANPELELQASVVRWSKKQQQLPIGEGLSQEQRDDLSLLFAVPNGIFTHKKHAFDMKRTGVRRGVSDLILPAPRGGWFGLFLELKVKGGKLQPEQRDFLDAVLARGYAAAVAVGYDEAVGVLSRYLALERSAPPGARRWFGD